MQPRDLCDAVVFPSQVVAGLVARRLMTEALVYDVARIAEGYVIMVHEVGPTGDQYFKGYF